MPEEKNYSDVELTCGCGASFVWAKGEQKFMDKLLEEGKVSQVTPPKRCPDCRAAKKNGRRYS